MLASLALNLSGLVGALGHCNGEILDENTIAWRINDCVMPRLTVELLGGKSNSRW